LEGVHMSEQEAGRKAHREIAAYSAGLSQTNDPQQGARLVRAFVRIADPKVRMAIVDMVEKMESAPANC
jgi:hypothetical protein